MDSYGYIETLGYVTSIVAADSALKAANVTLKNCYFVKGGIVTIELVGDVAAVRAAVEAGSQVAKELGNFLSSNVIARVDKETKKILIDDRKKENPEIDEVKKVKSKESLNENYNEKIDILEETKVEKEVEKEEKIEEVSVEENVEKNIEIENVVEKEIIKKENITEDEKVENIEDNTTLLEIESEEKKHIKNLKKQFQEMRVIELKTRVNKLKTEYTWNQIKGMTKKQLIEILIKNS